MICDFVFYQMMTSLIITFCFFHSNVDGLADFRLKLSSKGECDKAFKYFNELFSIQKTLKNIKTTWKNQMNAIKDVASGVKAVAQDSEDAESKAAQAIDSLNVASHGDRTKWIELADKALRDFKE